MVGAEGRQVGEGKDWEKREGKLWFGVKLILKS